MWLFLTQYVKNNFFFFLLFGAIMWLFGVDRTFSQHFCNKMGQKKKKFGFFFWLFRENFDFLGLGWLFFTFFLLFVFGFLGLSFWAAQYVKHVKIASSRPWTSPQNLTLNLMAQGTGVVAFFLPYSQMQLLDH